MEEQQFATQRHTVTGPQQVYSPDPIRTRGGILSEVDEIEKVQKGKKIKWAPWIKAGMMKAGMIPKAVPS
jgi:hypothetical protein